MRGFLLFASGFISCLVIGVALPAYQRWHHPFGAIENKGYPMVQIKELGGNAQYELRQGESKLTKYGRYAITIPEAKTTFVLFKNNRGICIIRSLNKTLLVETDENSSVIDSDQ